MERQPLPTSKSKKTPIQLIRDSQTGPKKSLGQHWLVSPGIIEKICDPVPAQSHIIEVGPGLGVLTEKLQTKAKKLFLIETDARLMQNLKTQFANNKNIELFHQDVLKFDFNILPKANYWIVSNLPYNISVAILNRLLKDFPYPKKMLLMFQKEVAARIISKDSQKSFGSLSIFCQSLCNISKHCEVKPGAFLPPPKVDSTVLYFADLNPPVLNHFQLESLEKLMGLAFLQRRKILKQSLKKHPHYLSIVTILAEMEFLQKRPEALSVANWHQLIKALDKALTSK